MSNQHAKILLAALATVFVGIVATITFLLVNGTDEIAVSNEPATVPQESNDPSTIEVSDDPATVSTPTTLPVGPSAVVEPAAPGDFTQSRATQDGRIPVLLDGNTNDETDDKIAVIYALLNGDKLDIRGITTNAWSETNGFGQPNKLDRHTAEAQYIVDVAGLSDKVPVIGGIGVGDQFSNVRPQLTNPTHPGHEAVDFIISEAKKFNPENKLVIAASGKLSNVALAVAKDPSISPNIKITFTGGNYTAPECSLAGAFDCENSIFQDAEGFNFLVDSGIEFEMIPSLTASKRGAGTVYISPAEAANNFAGKGPAVSPIVAPHGMTFDKIGDFTADLWVSRLAPNVALTMYATPQIAVLLDPSFGEQIEIPAPSYEPNGRRWVERPGNNGTIIYWDNFRSEDIRDDIFRSFANPVIAQ